MAALQDIPEALAVHMSCFFPQNITGSLEEREHIVRKPNRRWLTCSELSGTEYLGLLGHLLSANLNGELALGISRHESGVSTGDDCDAHKGGEAGVVLSGQLELTIEDRVHLLEAGDRFSFSSHLQHRYANPSEREDTLVVWSNTPITLRK